MRQENKETITEHDMRLKKQAESSESGDHGEEKILK